MHSTAPRSNQRWILARWAGDGIFPCYAYALGVDFMVIGNSSGTEKGKEGGELCRLGRHPDAVTDQAFTLCRTKRRVTNLVDEAKSFRQAVHAVREAHSPDAKPLAVVIRHDRHYEAVGLVGASASEVYDLQCNWGNYAWPWLLSAAEQVVADAEHAKFKRAPHPM